MTNDQKIIRAKVGLLELAKQLDKDAWNTANTFVQSAFVIFMDIADPPNQSAVHESH